MAMHFSYANNGSGSKASKFAVVAAVHVAVGVLFVHSLNVRHISLSRLQDQVLVLIQPQTPPPPPPAEPPTPMPKLAPPEVFVPKVEVDVAPPPEPSPVLATSVPDPLPARPSVADPAPQPVQTPANANPGQMRTAVFADANGCALPAYPRSAILNEETGTTTLALLVGPDGRVSSARVQHTSGYHDLDRAAIQALSLCRFKPATNNGVPEAGWAQLAYVWKLD
jgi:protein TonB